MDDLKHIKEILDMYGVISIPYKPNMKTYFTPRGVQLYKLQKLDTKEILYHVAVGSESPELSTKNLRKAYGHFVKYKDNFGVLHLQTIERHKLDLEKNWDELCSLVEEERNRILENTGLELIKDSNIIISVRGNSGLKGLGIKTVKDLRDFFLDSKWEEKAKKSSFVGKKTLEGYRDIFKTEFPMLWREKAYLKKIKHFKTLL